MAAFEVHIWAVMTKGLNNDQKPRVGDGTPGPGRPKGVPNKTTALLKDAIIQAAINAGGEGGLVGYLQKQADEYAKGFLPLLGKVLPMQLTGEDGGPVLVTEVKRIVVDPNNP